MRFLENLKNNGIECGKGMLKGAAVATVITLIVTVIQTVIEFVDSKKSE